jgi:SRR1
MDPILDLGRSVSMLRKMESTIDRLEKSKFYNRFVSSLNCSEIRDGLTKIRVAESGLHLQPIRLVSYGIGSIESYPAPRLQLALITLLRRQLGADVASAEIFDPVLSATECHVVEQLGFKLLSINEHGCRKVRQCKFGTVYIICQIGSGSGMRLIASTDTTLVNFSVD